METESGSDSNRPSHAGRPVNWEESSPETLIPERPANSMDHTGGDDASAERRREAIARRAHELARERGFAPGAELDDWLQAEREIDARSVPQTPPEDQFTG